MWSKTFDYGGRFMINSIMQYLQGNSKDYISAVVAHIHISLQSVLAAVLIAVPLGIVGSRSKKINRTLIEFFSTLRIIPSLAILFVCIPILGVGVVPATVALTILAIPPILINTILSFQSIHPSILETATGMGMKKYQRFITVEFPLALPLILTGIRTATIEVIASATLASYIGGGGLGDIIFTGLGLYRMDLLLVGGLTVAILSLFSDFIFFLLYRIITRYQRV
jgi:osmoprotectant transport system permease protein